MFSSSAHPHPHPQSPNTSPVRPESRFVFRSSQSLDDVSFSSIQDGIYVLRKAHVRSTPSLRGFPNVAFKTVVKFFVVVFIVL